MTAPGMVFWHPKGWSIWQEVEHYMRKMFLDYGYQEVKTPTVMDKTLWENLGIGKTIATICLQPLLKIETMR
jgi:threonyl-tRNA synthetase